MKSLLVLEEIIAATQPQVVGDPPVRFSAVGVDSRTVETGSLFIALPGERTDGHLFVSDALDRGAAAALVSRKPSVPSGERSRGKALLMVEDSDEALHALGRRAIEKQAAMTRVGITGSNGKTTTKELVGGILRLAGTAFLTPGNHNSTIGIPLSVMPLDKSYRYGVFEMAMNRPGEMGRLADLVRPDWALITNIGTAHIGLLGSQRGIAEEKARIAEHFDGSQTCLVPRDDGYARFLADRVNGRVVYYGEGVTPDLEAVESEGLSGSVLLWRGRRIRLRLPGRHNVHNAVGALTLAVEMGIEPGIIADGLESARPLFGRGELIQGPVTILQDCYNANPESVGAALELVADSGWSGRVVLVLGPMKELGQQGPAGHAGVVQAALSFGPQALFLYGEEFFEAYDAVSRDGEALGCFWTDEFDDLTRRVEEYVRPGDLVVIKGSRAAALERIGEVLRKVEA